MRIIEKIAGRGPIEERVRIGRRKDFGERVCEIHNRIACRAYEIYEQKGKTDGHDLEDWFEAEKEIFHPLALELLEAEFSYLVRADINGFRSADLELHAEPRKLFILGRRIAKGSRSRSESTDAQRGEAEIYRVMDLPGDVNPAMMAAHLKNGILEIYLLKSGSLQWPQAASKAA